MGWLMSCVILAVYFGTEMTNWHLLPVAVIFAILGTVEEIFKKKSFAKKTQPIMREKG